MGHNREQPEKGCGYKEGRSRGELPQRSSEGGQKACSGLSGYKLPEALGTGS